MAENPLMPFRTDLDLLLCVMCGAPMQMDGQKFHVFVPCICYDLDEIRQRIRVQMDEHIRRLDELF